MAGPWEDFQRADTSPRGPWDAYAPPSQRVPSARVREDLAGALTSGWQNSATGLMLRGKLPETAMGPNTPWYNRLAGNVVGVAADIPESVIGAVGGFIAGGAVGGPAAPATAVIGAGAGGFAAPMALREALITAYNHDNALSWSGVYDIAMSALKGGGKGAVIGGFTAGSGLAVRAAAPALVGTAAVSTTGGRAAVGGAALGAELGALTTASAALEGHMPTWQDFMDNAILLGGLKGATHVAGKMRNVYAETGKSPAEVLNDARQNPMVAADLLAPDPIKAYHGTDQAFTTFDASKTRDGAFHFSTDPEVASRFAVSRSMDGGRGANVQPVYLDIRNPMTTDIVSPAIIAEAKAKGHDGLVAKDGHLVVFEPSQIRSTFEPSVPRDYLPLALEQRVKAAFDADQRHEMLSKAVTNPETMKLGEGALKDPVRYEYVTDVDTLRGLQRVMADAYQAEFDAARRGEVSNKQSAMEGLRMVADGSIVEHVVGTAENSGMIMGRAHILRGVMLDAHRIAEKYQTTPFEQLSPFNKLELAASLDRVRMAYQDMQGAGAEAGRALQALRAVKRDPSLMGEAEAMVKLFEGRSSMQDLAAAVRSLKDPAQMAKFATEVSKAGTFEKVVEAWKAGIFSGPMTIEANILGNVGKLLIDLPESAISAAIQATGRAMKGDPMNMAQFKARALAPIHGATYAAIDFTRLVATGYESVKNQGVLKTIRDANEAVKARDDTKLDTHRQANTGVFGEIVQLPFSALKVTDLPFRTIGERAEAYKMAVDRVTKEGFDPRTREFTDRVTALTQEPTMGLDAAKAVEVLKQIEEAGHVSVFSQRLGPKLEGFQHLILNTPLQFIFPAIKTPANLVSWAVQHVPGLNLMSGRWRADFAAGGERQANALARVAVGVALTTLAYSMAKDGTLTGGGLFDKDTRGTDSAAGEQPYSVKVGDQYYSYQRMEPAAKVFGIAADLVEMMEASNDERAKGKMGAMLVLMFGNATISTTYLSGLANGMQAVVDPERYGGNFMEQYAASLVPKAIGQVVVLNDPYKREIDGVLDAIQSQLPIMRQELLPKRDVWGEPAKNERLFSVLPIAKSEASQDKVRQEASRLSIAIADAPRFASVKGPFNLSERKVELTGEQRDIMKEVSGKQAMAWLAPIVNSPDWDRIPDFAKGAIYRDIISKARKQGELAALPPDDAARMKKQQEVIDRILREVKDAER